MPRRTEPTPRKQALGVTEQLILPLVRGESAESRPRVSPEFMYYSRVAPSARLIAVIFA